MYAIGLDYFHAETRKSPTVDGIVMRTKNGKEVRFPVNLTLKEKNICRKIVMIFDQQVCGFDIIRSKGKSYVCDVNGWSFVKGNYKYTKDCSFLLRRFIYEKFFPNMVENLNKEWKIEKNKQFHDFRPFKPNHFKKFNRNNIIHSNSKIKKNNENNSVDNFKYRSFDIESEEEEEQNKHDNSYDTYTKENIIKELKTFNLKKIIAQKRKLKRRDSLSLDLYNNSPERYISPKKFKITTNPELFCKNRKYFDYQYKNTFKSNIGELRSVLAIFRHQDRTPKQKMKMLTSEKGFLDFFNKMSEPQEVKLKSASKLKKVKIIAEDIFQRISKDPSISKFD